MTTIHPEAATALLQAMQRVAVSLGAVEYNVAGRGLTLVKLRCRWAPDMSYGRVQEPVPGDEEFQWQWDVWTRKQADTAPEHVTSAYWRGWFSIGEQEALRLLKGDAWSVVKAEMQAMGAALAMRLTR